MTFLNHKDYKYKEKDLVWNIKIENQVGEIYLKDSNFIFGSNADSTYVVISAANGAVLETLNPFKIEKERNCLIIDGSGESYSRYTLYNIPVDKRKYSKVTLKIVDRLYRGDTETSILIINTLSGKEYTISFNRREFPFVADIFYFQDGKFLIKYNVQAATIVNKYTVSIGLIDLEKIIKNYHLNP